MPSAPLSNKTLILILNWKKYEDTLCCLASLMESDIADADILVIDNASGNGSVQRIKAAFPQVRLIENMVNLGFAGGNNVGIRDAALHGYRFVLLLNSDTTVGAHFLEPLIAIMHQNERAGAVQALLIQLDDRSLIDSGGQLYYANGFATEERRITATTSSGKVFGVCAAAALYRTSLLTTVGGFDENYFLIYEDVDLSWKIQLAGYECWRCSESVVYHKRGISAGGKDNLVSLFYFNRNFILTATRYLPAQSLVKYIGVFLYRFTLAMHYARGFTGVKNCFVLLWESLMLRRAIQHNKYWKTTVAKWVLPVSVNYFSVLVVRITRWLRTRKSIAPERM